MSSVIERMWIVEAQRHTQHEDELWVVLEEFPGYVISNYGQIYSFRSHRLLQPTWNPDGYLVVGFRVNGKTRTLRVNRLVATAFIGPPEEGLEANHIDGDHENNHISNLEWVTFEENMRHVREVLRRPERWREELARKRAEKEG